MGFRVLHGGLIAQKCIIYFDSIHMHFNIVFMYFCSIILALFSYIKYLVVAGLCTAKQWKMLQIGRKQGFCCHDGHLTIMMAVMHSREVNSSAKVKKKEEDTLEKGGWSVSMNTIVKVMTDATLAAWPPSWWCCPIFSPSTQNSISPPPLLSPLL